MFKNLNILEILEKGLIGIAFLLAVLAYILLFREQKRDNPDKSMLKSIQSYTHFLYYLILVCLISQILSYLTQTDEKVSHTNIVEKQRQIDSLEAALEKTEEEKAAISHSLNKEADALKNELIHKDELINVLSDKMTELRAAKDHDTQILGALREEIELLNSQNISLAKKYESAMDIIYVSNDKVKELKAIYNKLKELDRLAFGRYHRASVSELYQPLNDIKKEAKSILPNDSYIQALSEDISTSIHLLRNEIGLLLIHIESIIDNSELKVEG